MMAVFRIFLSNGFYGFLDLPKKLHPAFALRPSLNVVLLLKFKN